MNERVKRALRVVVVDDNETFSRALIAMIGGLGLEVCGVAASVAEGLALTHAHRPDVVLMDVLLPDGDGIHATARVVGELETPTVVMSLRDDSAFRMRALEAGAVAFIWKPELANELERTLGAIERRAVEMDSTWGPEDEDTRDLGGQPLGWRENAAELERLDRLELTALVSSGLAQDLNTPLAALSLEIATLARHLTEIEDAVTPAAGGPPPRAAAAISRARSSALAMDDVTGYMTRMVRDFARFTRGRRSVQGTADIKAAVETAMRFSSAVTSLRATLALRVPRALIVGVAERTVVRVLVNLIVNAAEAFPRADTVKNQIVITADRKERNIIVEVADNAFGIPPEIRAHLFEPFKAGKRGVRGLGIGLAVARSLLREAHGDLELVETGPDGSRFRCTLPSAV
jgi:C4-dicarboxylate-specific signal transduction histidine kinase